MKYRKFLVATITVLAVAVLIFFAPGDEAMNDSETPGLDIPDDWASYSNVAFDFTFRYPPDAVLKHEGGSVKIQIVGPEHTEGEITDGFTFFIDSQPISDKLTLEEFSYQEFVEESEELEPIAEPREVRFGDRRAYQFSMRGLLGSRIERIQMESDTGRVFMISYVINGPEGRNYENTINKMIRSASIETNTN